MNAVPPADAAETLPAGQPWLAPALLAWFDRHGRHDLPWQQPRTPYRVWLSEIMLQQTQVSVVVGYFDRFVAALPDLRALAAASEDQVLALWAGLGYYSRARNLRKAARLCVERHGGELPDELAALMALPGIGRSTAGAILSQAHGQRSAILDGNVKRLLARLHGVDGWPGEPATARTLWQFAEAHLPHARMADYTQALMDFGATRCTRARPACNGCPLASRCVARREERVATLPQARPRREQPRRATTMLLLLDPDRRVLLERRPSHGVWGGLWSLPEADATEMASDRLSALGCCGAGPPQVLPAFTHVFTHFRLEVQPLLWDGVAPAPAVADTGGRLRWCDAGDIAALGLPAPVRALLARVVAPDHASEAACASAL